MQNSIHPHFSESAFLRYRDVIRTVIANFPSQVCYKPAPLSPITFSCRLRDAMRGLLLHRYDETIASTLETFHARVVVAIRGNMVVIGDKDTVKHETKQTVQPGAVVSAKVLAPNKVVTASDTEIIKALCLLSQHRILESIEITGISQEELEKIASNYDVEVMPLNGNFVLL